MRRLRKCSATRLFGVDNFADLVEHLAKVHPSRYRQLIDGLDGIAWRDVHPITEQFGGVAFCGVG